MENFFAKNLKSLREKKGYSQSELSRITQKICEAYNKTVEEDKRLSPITQASIARWEAGENSPSVDNIVLLRHALGVDLVDLIGKDLTFDNATYVDMPSDIVHIPVLGKIPAGMPLEAIEDEYAVDTIDIPKEWLKGNNKYFALKLEGDSMEPDYLDKDIVIFKQTNDCESGQDCCIRINGFDATFKRVRKQENGIMIIPLNENNSTGFISTFYSKEDIERMPIEILGIVKQIRRNK